MSIPLSYTILPRALITITGEDAIPFLQGLITNDITKATNGAAIYACLLSPQGKYLYDFFIFPWQNTLFLDCHAEKCSELIRKLTMYKLRSKVTLEDMGARYSVFSVTTPVSIPNTILLDDPRSPGLGKRLIGEKSALIAALTANGLSEDPQAYECLRLSLGIPEGEKDLIQDKSYPLEFGFDKLHAIDYKKGCYVGQEVTARTTYRGVVRKHIYKISGDSPLAPYDTDIMAGEHKIGTMLSSYEGNGLALIREDDYQQAKEAGVIPTIAAKKVNLSVM